MKTISVYNVSGTLAGVPVAMRKYKVSTTLPTTRLSLEVPIMIRRVSERSPLINPRRIRRRRGQDVILNWKILCLFMILLFGVLIGIHLLIIECKSSKK